jgi:hypothetical protein
MAAVAAKAARSSFGGHLVDLAAIAGTVRSSSGGHQKGCNANLVATTGTPKVVLSATAGHQVDLVATTEAVKQS